LAALVGERLGQGSFGMVRRLVDPSNVSKPTGQVLKIMNKKPMTNFHGIDSLTYQIKSMSLLSCEAHKHTNIVQFFEAHHLISHIFLFIEDGGAFDLNQRLIYRVRDAQELPLSEVSSILRQCVDGLHHMHSVQSCTVMRNPKISS